MEWRDELARIEERLDELPPAARAAVASALANFRAEDEATPELVRALLDRVRRAAA